MRRFLRDVARAAKATASPSPLLHTSEYTPMCGNQPSQISGSIYVTVEACIKTGAVIIVLLYMYYRKRLARSFSSASRSFVLSSSSAEAAAATSSLIFPFYYSLFFATAFVDVLTVALSLAFGGQLPPAIAALCWALSRLITEGLTIFLLHHGVGLATIQYSFTYAVMWALISFLAWYCVPLLRAVEETNTVGDIIAFVYLFPPLLAYMLLAFAPMKHLPRRPAVLPIALLMSAVFATLVLREALLVAHCFLPGPCLLWTTWSLLLWAIYPFVVYRALVMDSQWWQGLYHDPHGWAGNLNTPLLDVWGDGLLEAPASELASLMYQLETTPEGASSSTPPPTPPVLALTRERVPIIPFGQIFLRTDLKYRSGSNSRVYVGEWNSRTVAVKMLFAMELDAVILREFFQEARMLYSLRQHPNVLKCLGVAIMPPAACLVTELCEHGSMFDFLKRFKREQVRKERERRWQQQQQQQHGQEEGEDERAKKKVWQQPGVVVTVAAGNVDDKEKEEEGGKDMDTHLCDGGIKKQDLRAEDNDSEGNDNDENEQEEEEEEEDFDEDSEAAQRLRLENRCNSRGEGKMSERRSGADEANGLEPPLPLALPRVLRLQFMLECAAGVCHLHAHGLVHGDIKSLNFLVTAKLSVKLGDVGECRRAGAVPVGGGPVLPSTINWAPPEVLAGRATRYHPSMDVYSLGLVLHEVMTMEVPFHHEPFTSLRSQDLVQHIVEGGRPSFGEGDVGGNDPWSLSIPFRLQQVLRQCWHVDPRQRPSAAEVHAFLVKLLEEQGKSETEGEAKDHVV
ncbi:5-nucleotidase [Nannochloropsis oceanica]